MPKTINRKRLAAFYALALAIPLLFFVLLETGLRLFDYGDSLELFIPAPADTANKPLLMTNPNVAQRYFPKNAFMPRPRFELFLKQKPANGYRIFVLGGSTATSWPYPDNVIFSRILSQRLSDTFPDKYIEVVNTAISAINSFTLLDFMEEVLAHEPDAILIYAGHNEFYGALGAASSQSIGQSRWMIKTYLALLNFKTVQLIRDIVNGVKQLKADQEDSSQTLMGRMVGETGIPLNGETYQQAKSNFEANLREILAHSQQAGVPVLLSELVSNLRDHAPFVSMSDKNGRSADDYFAEAKALDQAEQYEQALEAYIKAKELDGLRFRAPEAFNDVIHNVATDFNVPVVPMVSWFKEASPTGIAGSNLMLEHLHPNVEGYFLMSDAFYDAMRLNRFVSDNWNTENILPATYYRRAWAVTDIDRALGDIRIINLTDHWPYPPKGDGERTIADFNPRDDAEALAYGVFQGGLLFTDAHIQMAENFKAQGDHDRALREYLAMINASPHNVDFYMLMVSQLMKQGEYNRALPLLLVSLEIKETAYANKWIGLIYMMQRQPRQARPYLEQAQYLQPDDMQVIYNLGLSYLFNDQVSAASLKLKQLQAIEPESPRTKRLEDLLRKQAPNN